MSIIKIEEFSSGWHSNYIAGLRQVPKRTFYSATGEKIFEYLPGEISFQWNRKWKKKPDTAGVTSYYPVVSNRVKEFLESNRYTGLGFYRAYEIEAGRYSEKPTEQTDDWWVVYPISFVMIDEAMYCGDQMRICPDTKRYVPTSPSSGFFMPMKVVPTEAVKTDFFGIANTPWVPFMYCLEPIAESLRKQKFTHINIRLASPP